MHAVEKTKTGRDMRVGIETNTRFGIGIGGSGRGWWNSGHAGNTGTMGSAGGLEGCSRAVSLGVPCVGGCAKKRRPPGVKVSSQKQHGAQLSFASLERHSLPLNANICTIFRLRGPQHPQEKVSENPQNLKNPAIQSRRPKRSLPKRAKDR